MTAEVQPNTEQKPNDKEYNFRQIERRLMEEKSEKERLIQEKDKLAREVEEIKRMFQQKSEEEDDSEPYVDDKKLNKKLAKFGEQQEKHTESKIQDAVQRAIYEERKQNYLKNNPDFYSTIKENAEKFLQYDQELAETILAMPDGFERQKLVYKNIKALKLDQPQVKQASIQEKIDANRRSPYYQPTGISNAPYAAAGDFSATGQKSAYEKMQELKNRLRI